MPTAPTPNNMPGAQAGGEQPPAGQPPADTAPPAAQQPPAQQPEAPKPPWEQAGEPFDPERAWSLIQNVRGENADLKARVTDAQPILDEHEQRRRDSQSDLDRANEDLTTVTNERDTWKTQAVRAKAEVLAAGKFVDAETAIALIGDLSEYTTAEGIDTDKLTARLEQLAADKPFLAIPAQPPGPPGFTPNPAQGQSGTGQQLPLAAQIQAAEKSGNHRLAIALKQQQLYQQK